jgi:enoyl-CoA hydratase
MRPSPNLITAALSLLLLNGASVAQTPPATQTTDAVRMAEIPFSATTKLTVERRGQIVLIGINRPEIQNRVDPETFQALAKAYYDYDHDSSLRAAVLFGHGANFSRGIDVDAFRAAVTAGKPRVAGEGVIDPLGKKPPRLTKPLIVAVHGDTWNQADELFLVADIRVASEDTNFGQDEVSHGRFPGGGGTVRFPREAGWGNAMRYILTGDHWTARDAYRMGTVQELAATPQAALDKAIEIADKVAACAPLGVQAALATAHLAVDPPEADALSKLEAQYGALYRTQDFLEGRKAEAEGRAPVYRGE